MTKENIRRAIAQAIAAATGFPAGEIEPLLEEPKQRSFGDLAFPSFKLAKEWKLSPQQCADKLAKTIVLPPEVEKAAPVGPFVNFRFSTEQYLRRVLNEALHPAYGNKQRGTVVIDYSSPNIAKPFHVGHLRATLIGNSLDRVHRCLGWKTISVNHLGDWGTQFGFVWAGCKLWGEPGDFTVANLVELYRRATALKEMQEKKTLAPEESAHPDVNEIARSYFVDLENGEPQAREFWQRCVDVSLVYLKKVYERLGVSFDHYTGESFYSDKIGDVRKDLEEAKLLKESQGALGVDLGEELGFARAFTPDGRSLYLTRDIAAAKYRAETFRFDKALYVVGVPQTLHFKQLKGVMKALGRDYAEKLIHVPFGHVLGIRTRGEGGFIELNDFLDEAFDRALDAYRSQVSKRPAGLDESEVATAVALSAIVYGNLSKNAIKDVSFNWEHALEFQGDTGPYLLYAFARVNGIKEKAHAAGISTVEADEAAKHLSEESARDLASVLDRLSEVLEETVRESEPSNLAAYAMDLAKAFSKAYSDLTVVGEESARASARLTLFQAAQNTLGLLLQLLGMKTLERM